MASDSLHNLNEEFYVLVFESGFRVSRHKSLTLNKKQSLHPLRDIDENMKKKLVNLLD